MVRLFTFLLIPLFAAGALADTSEVPNRIGKNLVRISVTSLTPDYTLPWNPGQVSGGVGAGFVIDGHLIMTNAHVVSNRRFIVVTRENDPQQYIATVKFVAHDSDLALLEISDPSFFENTTPLQFGGIPELESTVSAYGYPLGGDRASVTRGVVSRIDFLPYSHSAVDSHLAIQVDAAINPGNSGGPVIQDGKVVGVAFQGYSGSVAQNVGYIIPTPVIHRFLNDIKDGHYDHYVDLGITYFKLLNPAERQALGLPNDQKGVVVSSVFSGGTCDGILQTGDVLLSIENYPISQDGYIMLDEKRVELPEIVERKLANETVHFEVLRGGKALNLSAVLKSNSAFSKAVAMGASSYDVRPRFVLFGGLLFQPLDRQVMLAYNISDLRARYFYTFFVGDQLYSEQPEIIILSQILPDPINTYLTGFQYSIIDEINGIKIRSLKDVSEAFKKDTPMHVIQTVGNARPIILEASKVAEARERILMHYSISKEENLTEK